MIHRFSIQNKCPRTDWDRCPFRSDSHPQATTPGWKTLSFPGFPQIFGRAAGRDDKTKNFNFSLSQIFSRNLSQTLPTCLRASHPPNALQRFPLPLENHITTNQYLVISTTTSPVDQSPHTRHNKKIPSSPSKHLVGWPAKAEILSIIHRPGNTASPNYRLRAAKVSTTSRQHSPSVLAIRIRRQYIFRNHPLRFTATPWNPVYP